MKPAKEKEKERNRKSFKNESSTLSNQLHNRIGSIGSKLNTKINSSIDTTTSVKKNIASANNGIFEKKNVSTVSRKVLLQKTKIKPQPIRATYQQPPKEPKISERNVMNTIHNVTVVSPPTIRRQLPVVVAPKKDNNVESLDRQRTRTRTLEPDEIVILKNRQLQTNNEVNFQSTSSQVKESVAFEINFEEEKLKKNPLTATAIKIEDNEYESDFESYESDFESISNSSTSSSSDLNVSDKNTSSNETIQKKMDNNNKTSIKDTEKQLDSGAYELKVQNYTAQVDSIEERELKSEEQNDSGIGYNLTSITTKFESTSATNSLQQSYLSQCHETVNKRGIELMKKISFDTMTYSIFELKPIPYDYYMKVYGHMNTTQMTTQTNENVNEQDVQTDNQSLQTIWTQYPPKFSSINIFDSSYYQDRNGCGEENQGIIDDECQENFYETSIKKMTKFKFKREETKMAHPTKLIDYNRLNIFLQKSAITLSSLLQPKSGSSSEDFLKKSWLPLSEAEEYFELNCKTLPKITKIYANSQNKNFVLTIHDDHQTNDESLKICIYVWNLFAPKKPIYHLTGWGQISAIHINSSMSDVIVAGLQDGSLAIWHIGESESFHHIENQIVQFSPSQVILPKKVDQMTTDYGRVISIKSMNVASDSNNELHDQCQIISLHDFGLLTIWTVIQMQTNNDLNSIPTNQSNRRGHQSPLSRVKLIESACIDLHNISQLECVKSEFERTRSYFESNLYSDTALRELQNGTNNLYSNDMDDSNVMYEDIELIGDSFFVTTNKHFLLAGSKALNRKSLRKLMLDNDKFIHASALTSMSSYGILFIGQSDGSIKILQCANTSTISQQIIAKKSRPFTSKPTISSSMLSVPNRETLIAAKSCAIQNIIKDERQLNRNDLPEFSLQIKNVNEFSTKNDNIFVNCINEQILLHGLSLKQHYTTSIVCATSIGYLFAQCGKQIRCYDIENCNEINIGNEKLCTDMTVACDTNDKQYLVILFDGQVEVHVFRSE